MCHEVFAAQRTNCKKGVAPEVKDCPHTSRRVTSAWFTIHFHSTKWTLYTLKCVEGMPECVNISQHQENIFFQSYWWRFFFLKKWVKCFSKHREGKYLNWNSMMNCFSLLSVAISEQWASPGPQTWEEGTEGQSDLGSPPGAVLQHLAALFHHQHGAGKRSRLKKENQMERST